MVHDNNDGVAALGASVTLGRAPSAGERLFRDGLIVPERFDSMVAADARAWDEYLAMDEAALDAALGTAEAAVIDEQTGGRLRDGEPSPEAPALRLVANVEDEEQPVFREHFRLRVAGIRDGLVSSRREINRELKALRRLLMSSERSVLTDAFANLGAYVEDGRVLVFERIEHGVATIEACVGYDFVDLPDVTTGSDGQLVRRRVMRIRFLGVRGDEDPNGLAARLWLEAQLVGVVRQVQDDGPDCFGMLCAVDDRNDILPSWIDGAGVRARLASSHAKVVESDRTLRAFCDHAPTLRDADGVRIPYRLAVANRVQLLDAARLHRTGATPIRIRREESDVRFDYEVRDQLAGEVAAAVEALCDGVVDALRRLGIDGKPDSTVWGPPPSVEMSESSPSVRTRHARGGREQRRERRSTI